MPAPPASVAPAQPASQGAGPALERRYYLDLARPRHDPAALMRLVHADVPAFVPAELARFEPRLLAQPGHLLAGDEFFVHIRGPWDGGVRVTEAGPTMFELLTLRGHPEAGRIRFEAFWLDDEPGQLRFQIHSWARSRDGLVAFAYDTLGGGKLMQEAVWVEFCRRVAAASGGQALGPVEVETIRHEPGQPPQQTRHHAPIA